MNGRGAHMCKVALVLALLCMVVVRPQLGNKLSRVLSCVGRKRFGDDKHGLRELVDGQLLFAAEHVRKVLQKDGEAGLNGAAAGHNRVCLEDAFDDAEGVVRGAVDLVEHVVVRTPEQQRHRPVTLPHVTLGQSYGELHISMHGLHIRQEEAPLPQKRRQRCADTHLCTGCTPHSTPRSGQSGLTP